MIRVLLVIDVPFYRDGLERLLSCDGEMVLVAAVGSDEAAVSIEREAPDVVLMDLAHPDPIAQVRALRARFNEVRIVILGIDDTEEAVVSFLEAGIAGYVSRRASYAELVQVLRKTMTDDWSCSPRAMALLLKRLANLSAQPHSVAAPSRITGLTDREQQILKLVGKGLSNKRIATMLNISHATTKNHVHRVLGKLQLRTRAEIAAFLHRDIDLAGHSEPQRIQRLRS